MAWYCLSVMGPLGSGIQTSASVVVWNALLETSPRRSDGGTDSRCCSTAEKMPRM